MKDNCRVYMSDKTRYHLTCPMKDIDDTLDPARFMKIHRSYAVNIKHIDMVYNDSVIMQNKKRIPILDLSMI